MGIGNGMGVSGLLSLGSQLLSCAVSQGGEQRGPAQGPLEACSLQEERAKAALREGRRCYRSHQGNSSCE